MRFRCKVQCTRIPDCEDICDNLCAVKFSYADQAIYDYDMRKYKADIGRKYVEFKKSVEEGWMLEG